jgi:hypothetical protein
LKRFPPQYDLQPNDVLYFVHIPKTAGMTFRTIIGDYFPEDEICPATLGHQMAQVNPEQFPHYRLLRGHLIYVDFKRLLPPQKQLVYTTMLRDPIAQWVSHYEYIRRMPQNPDYATVKGMTLEEYIRYFAITHLDNNLQTYYLAKLVQFEIEDLSADQVFELAIASLEECAFVGLVERFQESLFLLSYIFGWRPIQNTRQENTGKRVDYRQQLSPETLALLESRTQLDQKLYERAKEIFGDRLQQMQADLQQRYPIGAIAASTPESAPPTLRQASHQASQQNSQPVFHQTPQQTSHQASQQTSQQASQQTPQQTPHQIPHQASHQTSHQPDTGSIVDQLEQHYQQRYQALNLPTENTYRYDFSQALRGSGWQRREQPAIGLTYRWTGPDTVSTLDLPLQRDQPLTLEFRLICTSATAPDILQSLTLTVEGQGIPLKLLYGDRVMALYRGVLPIATQSAPLTRLMFQVNRVTTFQETRSAEMALGGGDRSIEHSVERSIEKDNRRVGVAFNEVLVFPVGEEPQRSLALQLFERDFWQPAVDFLKAQVRVGDAIAAPLAFEAKCLQDGVLQQCSIQDIQTLEVAPPLNWVVVSKDQTEQIGKILCFLWRRGFRPVFANAVFVIFSTHFHLPRLSYVHVDVKPVYVDILKRTWKKEIASRKG